MDLGQDSRFGSALQGVPFSAHPRVEANGDIWNFGLSLDGRVLVYHLSPAGKMKNVGIINAHDHGRMLYDFLIT